MRIHGVPGGKGRVRKRNMEGENPMTAAEELIRTEADGSISFGNYSLDKKAKAEDFESGGDLYKVKTFREITKLERNGLFVYESVPGTAVGHFTVTDTDVEFTVSCGQDAQITLQMEEDVEYEVYVDDVSAGNMRTNRSGKLNFSVELSDGGSARVRIVKQ